MKLEKILKENFLKEDVEDGPSPTELGKFLRSIGVDGRTYSDPSASGKTYKVKSDYFYEDRVRMDFEQ